MRGGRMGVRKTGAFHPPQEILVLTCDICERDIGYEDGRRARAHLCVARYPNAGTLDDQRPAAVLCSRECLQAYAQRLPGPLRGIPPAQHGDGRPNPQK
jgi:hypothetical protein